MYGRYGHAAVLKPRFSVASMLWLHIDREDSLRSKVFMVSIWLRHSIQRRNYLEWPGLGGGWPALLICPLKPGRHIFVNNIAITNDRKSKFFPLNNTIILYLHANFHPNLLTLLKVITGYNNLSLKAARFRRIDGTSFTI